MDQPAFLVVVRETTPDYVFLAVLREAFGERVAVLAALAGFVLCDLPVVALPADFVAPPRFLVERLAVAVFLAAGLVPVVVFFVVAISVAPDGRLFSVTSPWRPARRSLLKLTSPS